MISKPLLKVFPVLLIQYVTVEVVPEVRNSGFSSCKTNIFHLAEDEDQRDQPDEEPVNCTSGFPKPSMYMPGFGGCVGGW